MKTNEELYLEEQQQILLDTQKAIGELLPALEKVASAIEPPKDEVAIKGDVTIANQPEAIAVTNLEAITEALKSLGDKLHTSIEKNAHKPPEAVTVKNQVDSVTVKNLSSTNKLLTELKKAIDGLDLNVTVEKQDIQFPTAAKDALPVRLSDGKSFYKAVQTAVTTGFSNSVLQGVDSTGKPRPIRVTGIDGNEANGFGVVVVDAGDYKTTKIDDVTSTEYYGATNQDGAYLIRRITATDVQFATIYNNALVTTFNDAWTDRATLTYGRIEEAF